MELIERLKTYEGTKEYQQKLGYFRQGKFYPYKDSLGWNTVGYGHLVQKGEDFSKGITEYEADKLLANDLANVIIEIQSLKIDVPDDWNDFLIIMAFQLGISGTLKFRKMISALKVRDYPEAIKQAKDSLWYRQTPNRIDDMIKQLTNK